MMSKTLQEELKLLEEKRKHGELDEKQFYYGLLDLLSNLKDALREEDIPLKDIKKQIPVLLTFIKLQIDEMKLRGN